MSKPTTSATSSGGQFFPAAQAFEEASAGKALILDVREKDELSAGLAQPAQWIATSEIEGNTLRWKEFQATLPKDKRIVVYCAAGGRAGRVASTLVEKGYSAINMGGFRDWLEAGLPIRKF